MIEKMYENFKLSAKKFVCTLCGYDKQLKKAFKKHNQLTLKKELEKFKLLESKARYSYIRNLALNINLERIFNILRGDIDPQDKYSTIYSLNPDGEHYKLVKDFIILEPFTYAITSVWSSGKLHSDSMKNYVRDCGLKDSLCDSDITGFYLIDYGILYTYDDNHRICHGQLFGDFSIDINKHYRIHKIRLTDQFLAIDIDSLKDVYLTEKEKLMYNAMQIDYILNNKLRE